jgi:hypothetical protein
LAAAQGVMPPSPRPPAADTPTFKNLHVFPNNTSRQELLLKMRFFTQSLGVRCTFCHVGVEGQPPSTYDFASDAKKEKLIARNMLLMAKRINAQDFRVEPTGGKPKVTCFTCHRGSPHPLTAPPPQSRSSAMSPTPASTGSPPATTVKSDPS